MGADPKCRWCRGRGKVMLLNRWADCECLAEETDADAVQALLDCVREFGDPETQTLPSEQEMVIFDFLDADTGATDEP